MQGYDKIFNVKMNSVIQTISPSYIKLKIPNFLIIFVAYFTSYVEFFGGLFLFAGLFKYVSLYFLGIDLLIVSFGMSVLDPVWKMDIVLPRFILLIFLLVVPSSWDIYCLQNLLEGTR
jgi:hypothetical protein